MMNISKSTNHTIGAVVSVIVTILMNFYGLMVLLFNIQTPHPHEHMEEFIAMLPAQGVELMLTSLYCFIIAFVSYEINLYFLARFKKWWNLIPRVIFSIILVIINIAIFSYIYETITTLTDDYLGMVKMMYRGRGLMISCIILGVSQIIYLYRCNQEKQLEVEKLLSENMRSQYVALKNQIDPHFLFNSLNTLSGLIDIDSAKAQQYIQRMSSFFRYSMQDHEVVSVGEEMDFARSFGELMNIRYGTALKIDYDIDPKILDMKILPFSIQTLIENAVKHNSITAKKHLTIKIFSASNNIIVENAIQPKRELESGEGIGLANLTKRYQLYSGQEVDVSTDNGIFRVSVPIINI